MNIPTVMSHMPRTPSPGTMYATHVSPVRPDGPEQGVKGADQPRDSSAVRRELASRGIGAPQSNQPSAKLLQRLAAMVPPGHLMPNASPNASPNAGITGANHGAAAITTDSPAMEQSGMLLAQQWVPEQPPSRRE